MAVIKLFSGQVISDSAVAVHQVQVCLIGKLDVIPLVKFKRGEADRFLDRWLRSQFLVGIGGPALLATGTRDSDGP